MGGRYAAKQLSTISQGFAQQIALDHPPAHTYSEEIAKVSAALPGYLRSLAPEPSTQPKAVPPIEGANLFDNSDDLLPNGYFRDLS